MSTLKQKQTFEPVEIFYGAGDILIKGRPNPCLHLPRRIFHGKHFNVTPDDRPIAHCSLTVTVRLTKRCQSALCSDETESAPLTDGPPPPARRSKTHSDPLTN